MDWIEQLSAQGYRITSPRRQVMQILASVNQPLSALDIYERAQQERLKLGMVTIYRSLDLFSSLGLVRRVHLEDGCHVYMPASPGHHHTLVCRNCDSTVEFHGDENLSELIQHVENTTGYHIEAHLLQFSGLCPDCRARMEK